MSTNTLSRGIRRYSVGDFTIATSFVSALPEAPYTTNGIIGSSGSYATITFTSSGYFNNLTAGGTYVDALVIGGGGGGSLGGGGAGGLIYTQSFAVASGSYNIVVGAGGRRSLEYQALPAYNAEGTASTFSTLTAVGGGRAGGWSVGPTDGGSGGGGSGGTDITGSGVPGQGYSGGKRALDSDSAGGGGGAGEQGWKYPENIPVGGKGRLISINGTASWYAGGGGASYELTLSASGGQGGGGYANGSAGAANTGGGGGGAYHSWGGAGGSGIVILKLL